MSLEIMERMEMINFHPPLLTTPFVDLKLWGKKELYHFFEFKLKNSKKFQNKFLELCKNLQKKKDHVYG